MLEDIKLALRISNNVYDTEIIDLIEEAKADLVLAGVHPDKAADEADPLIRRAIRTYAKASFGLNNPDADRYQQAYEMLKGHLSLSQDYKVVE